eukprot:IDg14625t1
MEGEVLLKFAHKLMQPTFRKRSCNQPDLSYLSAVAAPTRCCTSYRYSFIKSQTWYFQALQKWRRLLMLFDSAVDTTVTYCAVQTLTEHPYHAYQDIGQNAEYDRGNFLPRVYVSSITDMNLRSCVML